MQKNRNKGLKSDRMNKICLEFPDKLKISCLKSYVTVHGQEVFLGTAYFTHIDAFV